MNQRPDTYTVNEIHFMPTSSNRIFVDKSDAAAIIAQKDAEIARLRDLIEEQKGTIRALNMAIAGDESTSTENLIDSGDLGVGDDGLIDMVRRLRAEVERLTKDRYYALEREVDAAKASLHGNCVLQTTIKQQAERIAELERERDEMIGTFDKQIRALQTLNGLDEFRENLRAEYRAMLVETMETAGNQAHRYIATLAAQSDALAKARGALEAAKVFIRNGVALGFIRMPDADTPDPAHHTPVKIAEALAAIDALGHPVDPAQITDAQRWSAIETLMVLGNVELTQEDDGGYGIHLDPVENIAAQSWTGSTPAQAIDAAAASLGQPEGEKGGAE